LDGKTKRFFDATKKYPVFMYQYSGPGSEVANKLSTNDYWFMMLTLTRLCVACVDGRGGAGFFKRLIF
jgi:dipeptidyl-peptidase-4